MSTYHERTDERPAYVNALRTVGAYVGKAVLTATVLGALASPAIFTELAYQRSFHPENKLVRTVDSIPGRLERIAQNLR